MPAARHSPETDRSIAFSCPLIPAGAAQFWDPEACGVPLGSQKSLACGEGTRKPPKRLSIKMAEDSMLLEEATGRRRKPAKGYGLRLLDVKPPCSNLAGTSSSGHSSFWT
jgi:hypothetical protein